MTGVRFEAPNPGDRIYRKIYSVKEKESLGWLNPYKIGQLDSLDLTRKPPLRSHARGLLSRFQMDKIDGINVYKVLAINPAFYSKDNQENIVAAIEEGEAVLTTTDSQAPENPTVGNQDGDVKTGAFFSGLVGYRTVKITLLYKKIKARAIMET